MQHVSRVRIDNLDAQTRTQLFEEARVLLSPGRQVFLGKLQGFLCLVRPDELYEPLLLEVKGQLLVNLEDLVTRAGVNAESKRLWVAFRLNA